MLSVTGVDRGDRAPAFGPLAVAGCASIGAGVVHVAAAAAHAQDRGTALVFQVLAAAQIAWGAWALVERRRVPAILGVVLSSVALVGWGVAQTVGVGFVAGLGEPHGIGWGDAVAAALAASTLVLTARYALAVGEAPVARPVTTFPLARLSAVVVVAVLSFSAVARVVTGDVDHSHPSTQAAGPDDGQIGESHDHSAAAVVPPVAYDPGSTSAAPADPTVGGDGAAPVRRVDLSGVAGVSAQQQERAERLVEVTLRDLPQFSDPAHAEATGYRSIGDGFTGHEHYINWSFLNDDSVLDPNRPESLVYDTSGPTKKLVSAMFMLRPGTTLADVPDIGGPLTQWHIHDDLCFTDDPVAPRVAGVTSVGGDCTPPLRKLEPVPMIHVWIVAHPCGPFAALEGVAAGQVRPGEERLCDTAHGSTVGG